MRPILAILGVLVLLGGCSTPRPATRTSTPPPVIQARQSATTRYIEAEREQLAKTHVEGALVR